MKIFISVTLFFLLSACSSQDNQRREGSREFSFTDISGTYVLKREVKTVKKKLVTRSQVISSAGGSRKVLEKTIAVSQLGSLKRNPTMRPYASEFTVWLEGKKYQSRLQLVPEKKIHASHSG